MNFPSDNREHDCAISRNGMIMFKECKNMQSIKICSSLCPFFLQENCSSINYNEFELTEVGRGKVFSFANDLFLPNLYECLYCDVNDIEFSIVSTNKIVIDVSFQIKSYVNRGIDLKELYACDKWKKDIIGITDNKCPLIGIYTLNELPVNILGGKYRIDDRKEKANKISNILFTWLPGSKCEKKTVDVHHRPEFPNQKTIIANVNIGEMIEGKNNVILGELYLDKNYSMSIECYYARENKRVKEIIMSLGVFFPFPFVNYHHCVSSVSEDLQLLDSSEYCLVAAKQERIEKLFVTPMENNESFISGKLTNPTPLSSIEEAFHYDQYATFLQTFKLAAREKVAITSRWNEIPIISSVYNTLNDLYDNKFAPISLTIINNTDTIIRLRIQCLLADYGIESTEQISIKAGQEQNISIKPELSEKELRCINEITKTQCRVSVYSKEGTCLWDDGNILTILPRETYVRKLTGKYREWKVDLSSYIARWVTPHAPCIDEIIAHAGGDNGMPGTLIDNTDTILRQMKDIYDYISKNIKYITRSMSFGEEWYETQRVCLPTTTMKLKSGNCIDLSVLLASCYEALRFDVNVIMLKNHAFLKVQLGKNYSECIECTYLGRYEFSEAIIEGRKEFEENFNQDNSPKQLENVIVNIKHSRHSNILPME